MMNYISLYPTELDRIEITDICDNYGYPLYAICYNGYVYTYNIYYRCHKHRVDKIE